MSGFATTLDYVLAGLTDSTILIGANMMDELGVEPEADPGGLSGGEARRAALVRISSPEPEILLLDYDQSPRSGRDRMAGGAPRGEPLCALR